MKKSVFFDSWAWIGITDRKDPYHKTAKSFYEEYLMQGGIPVTTDYVLDEVFTILRKRLVTDTLITFGENIFLAEKKQKLKIESIDRKRMENAWKLLKKYHDKSDISFTDFTSFAVMSELGITEVFTGDEHFEKVNKYVNESFRTSEKSGFSEKQGFLKSLYTHTYGTLLIGFKRVGCSL